MKNLTIVLALVALGTFTIASGLFRMQANFTAHFAEQGGTDPVDLDSLHFWSITPEAIQAEDPNGWAVFVQQTKTDGEVRASVRNDLHTWSLIQRHAIFLRRFGYPYEGSDIE